MRRGSRTIFLFVQDRDIFIMPEGDELQIVYEAKDSNKTIQILKALGCIVNFSDEDVVLSDFSSFKSLQPAKKVCRLSYKPFKIRHAIDPRILKNEPVSLGYTAYC